jgi:hypothetical protein
MLVSSPCRVSASGEILTAWPTHLLAAPHLHMLQEIIILGYFLVIPFLIPMGIFLVSDATNKTHINVHLVVFILGTLLKKYGLMHTLWNYLCISFGVCKTME